MAENLGLLRELCGHLAELVRLTGEAQHRRALGVDNLVTPEEIRAEVGWGDDRLRAWLRTLPIPRYPGKKTDLYRWGDVLKYLPSKESPAGGPRLVEEDDVPQVPRGDKFASR